MARIWIPGGGLAALLVLLVFPPWHQLYNGHQLVYNEAMGHHFLSNAPQATGEDSWIQHPPASECQVKLETITLVWMSGMVMAITMVLLFAVGRNTTGGSIPASLTSRKLMMIWALLALCLPMPAPDGLPTIFYVFMAPLSLLSDGGHVGPWAGLLWAGLGFGRYFILLFIPAWTLVWLVRRRLQSYPGSV